MDVITYMLLQIFPEISGEFPEILNFRKIYNPTANPWRPRTHYGQQEQQQSLMSVNLAQNIEHTYWT